MPRHGEEPNPRDHVWAAEFSCAWNQRYLSCESKLPPPPKRSLFWHHQFVFISKFLIIFPPHFDVFIFITTCPNVDFLDSSPVRCFQKKCFHDTTNWVNSVDQIPPLDSQCTSAHEELRILEFQKWDDLCFFKAYLVIIFFFFSSSHIAHGTTLPVSSLERKGSSHVLSSLAGAASV